MAEYNFIQRKKDILGKMDKSHEGGWDKNILNLCNKINKKENYYTTSSCPGRSLIMVDQIKKGSGLFLWKSHKKISLTEINDFFKGFKGKELLKFKCEPPILHVVSKTLGDARIILEKGFKVGWKKSGIISLGKNIVVEFHGSEKLEFPICNKERILVSQDFLRLIVKKSNKKLEKSWKLIKKLEKVI